ncbi:hypothetical protein D0Y65_028296 [Glycine soja]|uniref:Reverse transcriptase zinc-binding domain-containing protein n=2 Tax=Glycine subgen. Soja TaxID=1462606 RepID=A0A0R0HZT7_SOYBN|nr:hypothetical protein JHK87_029295 [Glycine soja]RZB89388.1 hypothetical protein D0Y65_028296 [Glycine soja]
MEEEEDVHHLFYACQVTASIWRQVIAWVGVNLVMPQTFGQLFKQFGGLLPGRKSRRVKHILWHATCWCVWLSRNAIIFK